MISLVNPSRKLHNVTHRAADDITGLTVMPNDVDRVDREVTELLAAIAALLETIRRLSGLTDSVLTKCEARPLTPTELSDARHELETARVAVEKLEAMVTLRRQGLRPF